MKKVNTKLVAASLAAIAVLGYCLIVNAGNLEPSAGPGSTMKTLDEVEPRIPINQTITPGLRFYSYVISHSCSYYLTGNVETSANKAGIQISADNVTIDLNGHTLSSTYPTPGFSGINSANRKNITLRNGNVKGFLNGVYFSGYNTRNIKIFDMNVDSSGNGFYVMGLYSEGNYSGGGHTVKNCTASDNKKTGFLIYESSTVENCAALNNDGNGFNVQSGSTVKNCKATANLGKGIIVSNDSAVINCTTRYNTEHGIYTSNGCVLDGNSVSNNKKYGIYVGSSCVVKNNTLSSNLSYGIHSSVGCVISDNTVRDTDGSGGIYAGDGSTVKGNSCYSNKGYGIYCRPNCLVTNNTCYSNTGNNLYAPSSSCTIGINHAP
jgi:parallel beta-helix repeat protein